MKKLDSNSCLDFDGLKILNNFLRILSVAESGNTNCQYQIVDGKPSAVIRTYTPKDRGITSIDLREIRKY